MKFKRIAVSVGLLIMSMFLFVTSAFAAEQKNETVYAALNHDGSVNEIYVVNQLFGDYIDYGEYTNIKNLSTLSEPIIKDDKITFADEYVEGGLFYQGTIKGELPMVFDIKYFLDGKQISARSLGGETGHLKIEIEYKTNYLCEKSVRDGFMAQIILAINMNNARNIDADDAAAVLTGSTMNVSYTVLPDESGKVCLEADINDFEMDPIAITLLKGSLSFGGIEDSIGEFQDGFDEMLDGADEMLDGTSELKDGVSALSDGVGSISYGMSKLKSSGADMLDGMERYSDGLAEYLTGIEALAPASSQIQTGLDNLSKNGAAVTAGITDIDDALYTLTSSTADLKALADSLQSSADPSVQALAQGTVNTLDSLAQLAAGLDQATGGLIAYTVGVTQTATQYKAFDAGINAAASNARGLNAGYNEIKDGFALYTGGIKSSASGIYQLYVSIKGLPDNIQELINGQIDFKDGISTAKDDISSQTEIFTKSDTPAVSFASPDKNHPESVQYILTTPGISLPKQAAAKEIVKAEENFFTRLAALFQ